MRVLLGKPPYRDQNEKVFWTQRGIWPCKWIYLLGAEKIPFVVAYRKKFELDKAVTIRVHVSADERYELYLDGKRIGRGPERGDPRNWFFETYDLDLTAGAHVIVARVWSLGREFAPYAQMTLHPGFILSPEGEYTKLLGTGVSPWEAKQLGGYRFLKMFHVVGGNVEIAAESFSWGVERGEGDGWGPVHLFEPGSDAELRNECYPGHMMRPAMLPPMMDEERKVGTVRFVSSPSSVDLIPEIPVKESDNIKAEITQWDLIAGSKSITVPARSIRRVIFDLDNYYCAYSALTISGGARSSVKIGWVEALFENPEKDKLGSNTPKGNRNEIEGKFFWGPEDVFLPDGGPARTFEPLWWKSGRYVQMTVQTDAEPLTIDSLKIRETRYPLEMETSFHADDPRLESITPIALRGLQMCSHETFFDCPYYEQLMYVGDSRLEALTVYSITHDDRLPRKCLKMFDVSRLLSGLTQSRYPSRITQVIPPFSLWWVGMVYDYVQWRDDMPFVKSLMPGVRSVTDCFRNYLNADGLVEHPKGWNAVDWVPGWVWGAPPEAEFGVNGTINWHTVLAFEMAAEIEMIVGEKEMAARDRKSARTLATAATTAFWDESRGLFSEDREHQHFSEHTNCLAILSGYVDPARREAIARALPTDPNLDRTTIYFSHYLFETFRELNLMDAFFDKLKLWYELEENGLKTTIERPEPSRSDCHAWGAHPIYHYFASILGIRPGSAGFRTVVIEPRLGPLTRASGALVHPKGMIEVDLRIENGELRGSVALPEGVSGTLIRAGKRISIKGGRKRVF